VTNLWTGSLSVKKDNTEQRENSIFRTTALTAYKD